MEANEKLDGRYETWTQTAFTKTWEGCSEVGIVQKQMFYSVNAEVGATVHLRKANRMSAYGVECSTDGGKTWSWLRNGRAI